MGSGSDGIADTTDRNDNPNVFNLNWNGEQLNLNGNNAKPDNRWNADNEFVFRFRNCVLSVALGVAVFLFRIGKALLPATEHPANLIQF